MIPDDEARKHVAEVVGQREQLRQKLAQLIRQKNEAASDQYRALIISQAVFLGKLGGLYIALGMNQQLIHEMMTDTYWSGLGDKQREYGGLNL
ncbi:hypothetical protein BH10CYA1_BH10CYA1_55850 [soil metagenome]